MLKENKVIQRHGYQNEARNDFTFKNANHKDLEALKLEYQILAAIQKRDTWGEVYKRYMFVALEMQKYS